MSHSWRISERKGDSIRYREPRLRDGDALWRLARGAGNLDVNSPYAYLLFTRFFSDTCAVAEHNGSLAGFVLGFRPPAQPDTLFVWQIAVAPELRGRGIGVEMLGALLARLADGVRNVAATVTPSNVASQAMFRAAARGFGAQYNAGTAPLFPSALFPGGQHEDELAIHIGPIDVQAGNPARVTEHAAGAVRGDHP